VRKVFNLTTVAAGAATGMIIVGALALIAGFYTRDVVHDQLAPQQIFFPEEGEELPPELNQYAGEQVDTGAEAKAYADDYIGAHLEGIGGGKSYSQVSGEFMQDPNNKELAEQRQTMFMGETLRGLLLNAWGWGTIATLATIAGIVLIVLGLVLLVIPLLAARAARREAAAQTADATATPTPA
jgi:uncharacterized membrane protein YtjA (UPF0391 family)